MEQQPPAAQGKKRRLIRMNPGKLHPSNKKNKRTANKEVEQPKAEETPAFLHSTFMPTRFHKPPPLAPIFSDSRMLVMRTVFPEQDDVRVPQTSVEYSALLERMRNRLSAGPALRFVVERKRNHARKEKQYRGTLDKANSLRAVYKPQAVADKQATPEYARALKLLGVLEGRFHQYVLRGGMRAEAAQLDKSGLAAVAITKQDLAVDIPTSVFVVLATLEFSARKAFTLEKQQQGALNPALQSILREALEAHSKQVHWPIVFHVYPNAGNVARLTSAQKESVMAQWTGYQSLLARFLQTQWTLGVRNCASRRMLVPAAGGSVDSDGWNRVAGAWNNSIRFVRLLAPEMPNHPLHTRTLFKCLKLTAGDQLQWAAQAGKNEDPDTHIFAELVKEWLPWNGLAESDKPVEGLRARIEKLCAAQNVPVHRWLGSAEARKIDEMKVHGPMICGVAVPSWVTQEQANVLKAARFAGAKA